MLHASGMMWALHKCQNVEEGTLELRADDLKFTVALILSPFLLLQRDHYEESAL